MSEEILINATSMETRVALVDDGVVQEFHIERNAHRGIVGNIYAGTVRRILPGMEAAFIDIGAQRTAFLHVSDIAALGNRKAKGPSREADNIGQHLHEGKKLLVQVVKAPLGDKGARVSTALSLSTRSLVLLPQSSHIGVSQQIGNAQERARLQQVLVRALAAEQTLEVSPGFILRTAAEGVDEEEIKADLRFLMMLWTGVSQRGKAARKAQLLYAELPLYMRIVRDMARPSVTRILVDRPECFAALKAFCDDCAPDVSGLLELHSDERPLFERHAIEEDLQRALQPRVELPSDGHLIIEQTEAMATIDVNTGSFVGARNQAQTILETNLEAATALVRQLRLRNLGGIVVIDFIDMLTPEHRAHVQRALQQQMQRDSARHQIGEISALGLVEMTRKRTRESLAQMLCESCPLCEGRGAIKTVETVCYDIFRALLRVAKAPESEALTVLASPAVVERLQHKESVYLDDLQQLMGKPITLRTVPEYNREQFDIIPR